MIDIGLMFTTFFFPIW